MPKTNNANFDSRGQRQNWAEDASFALDNAGSMCNSIAMSLEDDGNDPAAWINLANELHTLHERMLKLAR